MACGSLAFTSLRALVLFRKEHPEELRGGFNSKCLQQAIQSPGLVELRGFRSELPENNARLL
jgi:hypothetical protein